MNEHWHENGTVKRALEQIIVLDARHHGGMVILC